MKKSILALAAIVFFISTAAAQKLITVQSLNGVHQYESPDSALYYAADGDQVFFPGGIFVFDSLVVSKSLMIFGAGHFYDSTLATGVTNLVGDIILSNGASGGIITGFLIDGDIRIDSAGKDSVSNFTISRCSFGNLYLSATGVAPTSARNFSIYENIIHGNLYGARASGINCSKNFIEGGIIQFQSAVISNNDFIGLGNCTTLVNVVKQTVTCNFDNNIFLYNTPGCSGASFMDTATHNNTFMNNMFVMFLNFPVGNNPGFNNIVSQPLNTIFVSAIGNTFQYTDDYHLKPGSPGVYGGTDGTDLGVYGTMEPFKAASVPFNPHIRQKSIGQTTNPQGQINIHIKVAAQEN